MGENRPRTHVIVSALRAAPAFQALSRWPGATLLSFDVQVDERAGRIVAGSPPRPEPGIAAVRLGSEDLDVERMPDLAADLAGTRGTRWLRQRRLDTWFAADLALSARIEGLVVVEGPARVAEVLRGGMAFLREQRPWLVVAAAMADAAALCPALADVGYVPAGDSPGSLQHGWLAAAPAGDALGAERAALCRRLLAVGNAGGVLDTSTGLWGWGLMATPYPQRDFPWRFDPRGHSGLVLPGVLHEGSAYRLRLRRDDVTQPLAAPQALLDGRLARTTLGWSGRDGELVVSDAADGGAAVRTLELSWGTAGLVTRSFSGESPLALGPLECLTGH